MSRTKRKAEKDSRIKGVQKSKGLSFTFRSIDVMDGDPHLKAKWEWRVSCQPTSIGYHNIPYAKGSGYPLILTYSSFTHICSLVPFHHFPSFCFQARTINDNSTSYFSVTF
ncbi:hypothetical protein, unlikely [Trypanosoma brucei gambiense DAL972]|uniref:Uncharacterized protein n=1 Tax=Trypanosoma brucei gambiense (strain MHOM/CI/86/DAL972) TaxID=679716 RepID=C9ZP34_TRYB9|nr:hypothetical protein, unlikely [Trypanosoma brucei gambiense DAL972]CBH11162.1 hypothetical protein, unlikely [Trypanosoma brucei gambiense DAL972]|eukprot:XP_011773449.1 hypothetical protein, unlikely [Trypanosoma brucei gambiense DAL972]